MGIALPLPILELASRGAFFLSSLVGLLLMASLLPSAEIGKIYAIQFGCAVASAFLVVPVGLWTNKRVLGWSADGALLHRLFYKYILPVTALIVAASLAAAVAMLAFYGEEALGKINMIAVAGLLLVCQSTGMMSVGALNIIYLRERYCTALFLVSIMQVALPALLAVASARSWESWIVGFAAAHALAGAYSLRVIGRDDVSVSVNHRNESPEPKEAPQGELIALFVTAPLVAFITNYYKSVGFSDESAVAVSLMSYSVALMFGAAAEQLAAQKYGPLLYAQFRAEPSIAVVAELHRAQITVMYLTLLIVALNISNISRIFEMLTGVKIDQTVVAIGVCIEALRFFAARIQLYSQLSGHTNAYARTIFFAVVTGIAIEHFFIDKAVGYVPYLPMAIALSIVCLSVVRGHHKKFGIPRGLDLVYVAILLLVLLVMTDWYPALAGEQLFTYFVGATLSIPIAWRLIKMLLSEGFGVHE